MKTAFLFAGQGAQYSGMGKSLSECSVAAREIFALVDSVRPGTAAQCFEGTKEELSLTQNTQPCMFAVDWAAAVALVEQGVQADFAAGFSLGELPALAFTGVLHPEDAVRLVCKRAELMEQAATENPGKMAAILKLETAEIERICAEVGHVWAVNYNCPGQTVIAGTAEAIADACARITQAGGRAMPLPVSGAFHTPFMRSAQEGLTAFLSELELASPTMPIYSNVTARPYADDLISLLSAQVCNPVRWEDTVRQLAAQGAEVFIEVGPGKTLSGLVKRILPDACIYHVEDEASLNETVAALGL